MKKLIWKNVWQTLAAVVFLIGVWIVAYFHVGNELLVPSFRDSLKECAALFAKAAFWEGLLHTLDRTLFAFLISFLFGLIFAIVAYLYPSFSNFFTPIVSALRSMPVMAVLLILLSIGGVANAPVMVAFMSLFPMLYTGIFAGVSSVDKHLIAVSRVQGTPLLRRVTAIYLPLSSPYILREAGGALSFSLKLVVSAEILALTASSLGGMLYDARTFSNVPQLFALVAVIFLLGLLLEMTFAMFAAAMEKKIK
ncbi:MAG: ABC transporter permease subunit [Clostridia bacterium]|nr:ABC transporter permease subunit [Clostridia bacterium]